ncbi:MAG TPA: TlpA disulfide reductase family protein [Planctomycetota bacterium]
MSSRLASAGLVLAAAAVAACGAGESAPEAGRWRAWLESPGGELPFGLDLALVEAKWIATVVNGEERLPARATLAAGRLRIDFLPYDSWADCAILAGGRRLEGTWTKRRGEGVASTLPFRATLGAAPRFARRGAASGSAELPDGRWAAQFSSSGDPALAIFRTRPDGSLFGTFLTTTGDYRFLAGRADEDGLRLSCFDGAHAFLFTAGWTAAGGLAGDFWSADAWHETWTAERSETAAMPDAFGITAWSESTRLEDVVLPDLDGVERSLADPAFAAPVRLLQVFGSWCPNCNDEADYLVELRDRYAGRGLAILGLAFEHETDPAAAAVRVRAFQERHGADWPVLLAGPSDKDAASAAFPALDRVRSYPTTIFLDHRGKVRAVHTGFSGPATGAAHAQLRDEFEGRIERLLAEAEAENR